MYTAEPREERSVQLQTNTSAEMPAHFDLPRQAKGGHEGMCVSFTQKKACNVFSSRCQHTAGMLRGSAEVLVRCKGRQ